MLSLLTLGLGFNLVNPAHSAPTNVLWWNCTDGSISNRTATPPGLNSTFLYDLDQLYISAPVVTSSHGVSIDADVYIIDAQTTPQEHIDDYHNANKTVMCYFSAGSWEPKRPDHANFPPECYCGKGVDYNKTTGICTGPGADKNMLDGWPEWYLDIHDPDCYEKVKAAQLKRIESFIAKGCDGLDPDNIDAYSNVQQFNITEQNEIDYIFWIAQTAKDHNLLIDLKNAGGLIIGSNGVKTQWADRLVETFDFAVIEQCHEQDNCNMYDMFTEAGKPQIQIEYVDQQGDNYTLWDCPFLLEGEHLLVYDTNTLNASNIRLQCNDTS